MIVVWRRAAVPPALLAAPPEPVDCRGRRLWLPRLSRGRRGHALPVAGDGAGPGPQVGRAAAEPDHAAEGEQVAVLRSAAVEESPATNKLIYYQFTEINKIIMIN